MDYRTGGLMTYEELFDFWVEQKPQGRQTGKTIWLMVAMAIEKQIPKKPNIVGEFTKYFECPICGHPLSYRRGCENNKCRQAIDWS